MPRPATRRFFSRDPESLARALLGTILVRTLESGEVLRATIVETEAYLGPHDRASHAYNGRRTPRNESMYAKPGTLYVYFTYGMHHCANIVCGSPGEPVAVLLRALEPIQGLDTMRANRSRPGAARASSIRDHELCRGPGNLCKAFALDRTHDGLDVVEGSIVSVEIPSSVPIDDRRVSRGPRIGIGNAGEWTATPARFWVRESRSVSRSRREPTGGERSV